MPRAILLAEILVEKRRHTLEREGGGARVAAELLEAAIAYLESCRFAVDPNV